MNDQDRYETQAFCTNCGYEGPVQPLVGVGVFAEPCPICRIKSLVSTAYRDWRHAMDNELQR